MVARLRKYGKYSRNVICRVKNDVHVCQNCPMPRRDDCCDLLCLGCLLSISFCLVCSCLSDKFHRNLIGQLSASSDVPMGWCLSDIVRQRSWRKSVFRDVETTWPIAFAAGHCRSLDIYWGEACGSVTIFSATEVVVIEFLTSLHCNITLCFLNRTEHHTHETRLQFVVSFGSGQL